MVFYLGIYILFFVYPYTNFMKKLFFILPGYCVGFGGLLLITYRTLLAFGSESKAITVHVNRFGEAYLDVIALVFLWMMVLVGLLTLSRMMREKTRNEGVHSGWYPQRIGADDQVVYDGGEHRLQAPCLMENTMRMGFSDPVEQKGFSLHSKQVSDGVSFSVTVSQDTL
jgi:hypothetical protein